MRKGQEHEGGEQQGAVTRPVRCARPGSPCPVPVGTSGNGARQHRCALNVIGRSSFAGPATVEATESTRWCFLVCWYFHARITISGGQARPLHPTGRRCGQACAEPRSAKPNDLGGAPAMRSNPADEIADRTAEERSEDEGMPEHASKALDPVRWAAERSRRVSQRMPGHSPGRTGILGVALVSCAALAALTSARSAVRGMRHRGGPVRLPR
jgi:hypothetical protein